MQTIERLAEDLFGDVVSTSRGGLECLFECPNCDRPKLSVNIETGGFGCWRCGYKGFVQNEQPDVKVKAGGRRYEAAKASGSDEVETLSAIQSVPVRPGTSEYAYLRGERGLTDDQIDFYGFRRSSFWKYRQQVIIPVFDGGYRGFQRRFLKPLDNGIRYINGKGFKKKSVVYNLDNAIHYPEIRVCEGIFSGIAAGRNAVCLFGKDASRQQARRLAETGKTIVMCLDGGEILAEVRLAAFLFASGARRVDRISLPVVEVDGKRKGLDPDDVNNFEEIADETRETISPTWLIKQKAKITRLATYGDLEVPKGFFKMLNSLC